MFAVFMRFIATTAAVPLCVYYMDGVHSADSGGAIMLGAILAVIYMILRPVTRLILAVFNFCTLGLLNVAVDAWLIWTVAIATGKRVTFDNFWWAVAVAVCITAMRTVIDALMGHLRK